MTEQHIAILRQLVARAEGADMDVGLSTNILAALLDERDELVAALCQIESHHVDQNRIKGRDESRSYTLRVVRAALQKAGRR